MRILVIFGRLFMALGAIFSSFRPRKSISRTKISGYRSKKHQNRSRNGDFSSMVIFYLVNPPFPFIKWLKMQGSVFAKVARLLVRFQGFMTPDLSSHIHRHHILPRQSASTTFMILDHPYSACNIGQWPSNSSQKNICFDA